MAEQQGTNGNRWTTITIGGLLLVVGLLVGLLLGQDGSDDTADLATQGEQDVTTTSAAPTTTESPAEPDAPTTSTTAPAAADTTTTSAPSTPSSSYRTILSAFFRIFSTSRLTHTSWTSSLITG